MAKQFRRLNQSYISLFISSLLATIPTLFWLTTFTTVLSPQAVHAAPQSGPMVQAYGTANSAPLTLAFYYTWFDENSWNSNTLSDMPASLYNSRDRATMGRHIEQAQQAGIDAFLVAWYGPSPNPTETNLIALLEEAAARNFKIGILFESDSPLLYGTQDITNALLHAQAYHSQHPAFLRVDGRPVIFFWRPHIYSVATWQQIRAQVDPGNYTTWISEGVEMAYLQVFDGHHLYSNTWNPPTDLNYTNQKFARWVNNAGQQYGTHKYWVATVMPGYDDVRIRPYEGFAKGREYGAYYERSWQSAIDSNPDWIVITSFNEWPEGTYIEPSVLYGQQYLDLTRTWSQQYKAGYGVPLSPANIQTTPNAPYMPPTQPVQTEPVPSQPVVPTQPEPTITVPQATVPTAYIRATVLNLRQGPGVHYDILGQVPAGTALPILSYHPSWPDWWQVSHYGQSGWVYAPLVETSGPMEQVPIFYIDLSQ